MSFVDAHDVMGVIESLVAKTAKDILALDVSLPLPQFTWAECMERYGHDAPDMRFGLEIVDLTEDTKNSDFRVFKSAVESGGRVRGILISGAAEKFSRKDLDGLTAMAIEAGAKGLVWLKLDSSEIMDRSGCQKLGPDVAKYSQITFCKTGRPGTHFR